MIIYLKNSEIDREEWDNCINNSSPAKPYAYSWFLDIMAPGWEALIDDDYDSVFPVPSNVRFGIQYAAMPAFIQQLGAYSPDKPAESAIGEFLDYMPEIYRLTDLCVGQKVDHPRYKVTEKSNFELDLSAPYEKLRERFTPECRKYLSDPAGRKYSITTDISPEELVYVWVRNKELNMKDAKESDLDRLTELMYYCLANMKGKIAGIRQTGKKVVYGIFLVHTPGVFTILLEANSERSVEKHLWSFVINEIIKENASSSSILDFAGTLQKSAFHPGQSFGGSNVPYYRIHRNRLFWPVRTLK